MNNPIPALIMIVIGLIAICFRKRLAKYFVDEQNKTWGIHLGEKEIKANEWLLPFLGGIAVVSGILIFLGIFKVK